MPVILPALLRDHISTKRLIFSDREIAASYMAALDYLTAFLGHDVHIGARYYDAYGSRMSRYEVLQPIEHLVYRLQSPFVDHAVTLAGRIPDAIRDHIDSKLGIVPTLGDPSVRIACAVDSKRFLDLI